MTEDAKPQAAIPRWVAPAGLLLALAWFVVGINWGLPSRRADPYLFGPNHTAWSGKEIVALAGTGTASPDRGADVDVNPTLTRDQPVVLNETDAQRAEIVRRYRLYSYQPDEMITFNALRQMNPAARQLDPKLYQYGGLWIYPVGALLKLASVAKLVDVRADVQFYLDNPDAFGRFYIVARLYSALWGVIGVWTVHRLVRHLLPACGLASHVAAACFAAMPVVVNMAHEAKPHLPGAVLMLLAVLSASQYVQTGARRSWITAAIFCGAAFGMVLSSLPVFVVLPLMTLLRRQPWRDRVVVTAAAALIAVDVYFLTNPYVLIHLIRRDPVLWSNLGNSTAMYRAGGSLEALGNALRLIAEGASPLLTAAGIVGAIVLARRAWRIRKDDSPSEVARRATGLLLAAPAALVAVQFVALAAGKPGEYGRFAILPNSVLAIEAVVAAATFLPRPAHRNSAFAVLLACTAFFGFGYLLHFIDDSYGTTTRLRAAAELSGPPPVPIAVDNDPAPYSFPPVNLFDRKIILLPRSADPAALTETSIRLRPVDDPAPFVADGDTFPLPRAAHPPAGMPPARISWAGKTFEGKWIGPPSGQGPRG